MENLQEERWEQLRRDSRALQRRLGSEENRRTVNELTELINSVAKELGIPLRVAPWRFHSIPFSSDYVRGEGFSFINQIELSVDTIVRRVEWAERTGFNPISNEMRDEWVRAVKSKVNLPKEPRNEDILP